MLITGQIKSESGDAKAEINVIEMNIVKTDSEIQMAYKSIPKVYYGTRTHRQIKQIIKVILRPSSLYYTISQSSYSLIFFDSISV